MKEYKSREISFFKNKKLFCIGDPILPSLIKLVKKVSPGANSLFFGKLIEIAIIVFIATSIVLLAFYR